MELPGLAEKLYGITKERAHQLHVCVNCKKEATWYSPAGAKEYRISGLCEPCFDKITGEPMKNTTGGSDVTHVINGDHKTAAEAYLIAKGFTEWEVVLPDEKMLMLDYDDQPRGAAPFLPEQFFETLEILEQLPGQGNQTYYKASMSKGGNTHVIVHLTHPMPIVERIAWQAAFGSDHKREALHLLSVALGDKNPILLFMRKKAEPKLLSAASSENLLTEEEIPFGHTN